MNLQLGNFELDKQDLYAILAILLIALAFYFKIPLPYITPRNLLFLAIVFLLARAFLPAELIGYLFFAVLLFFLFSYFFSAAGVFFQIIVLFLLLFFLLGFFSRR